MFCNNFFYNNTIILIKTIFSFAGLEELESECNNLNIQFHFLIGCAADILPDFVKKHKLGAIVVDFMPVREHMLWTQQLAERIGSVVPVIQVDAHNIVPCWVASDKQEYAARTIRNKINNKLPEYLTEFPPVIKHPFSGKLKAQVCCTIINQVHNKQTKIIYLILAYQLG
jgi:deoxyribodipyrimidine photo-lyase